MVVTMKRMLKLLGLGCWFAATAHAGSDLIRVQAAPSWTIAIPRGFEQIHNGDSWQAADDERVIYVSSMRVSGGPNESLVAAADGMTAKVLTDAPGRTGPIIQYHADDAEGRAAVFLGKEGFNMKGFMMAKGRVAMFVVSYADPKHQSWAADTWRSLRLIK